MGDDGSDDITLGMITQRKLLGTHAESTVGKQRVHVTEQVSTSDIAQLTEYTLSDGVQTTEQKLQCTSYKEYRTHGISYPGTRHAVRVP